MKTTEKSVDLYLNFPLLQPLIPPLVDDIKNPLALAENFRLNNLARMLRSKTTVREIRILTARIMRDTFGAVGSTQAINEMLAMSFQRAQEFVDMLIKTWMPESFHNSFSSEGVVNSTRDLADLCFLHDKYQNGNDPLTRQREFETRRMICLGMIFFELFLLAKEHRKAGEIFRMVTEYLQESFFKDAVSVEKHLIYYQDPKDEMRIKYCHFSGDKIEIFSKGLFRGTKRMVCRVFQWAGKDYVVYFETREKNDFSHLIKMFHWNMRDPTFALDQIGFKMIFFNNVALSMALEKIRAEVFQLPGTTWKFHDSISEAEEAGVERNESSSDSWRVLKFVTKCRGFWVEGMMELAEDYLNETLSIGDEHHNLYKLRLLLDYVFQRLFPTEIYNIDWKAEEIRRVFSEMQKAKIK